MGRKSNNIMSEVEFVGGLSIGGSAQILTIKFRDGKVKKILIDFGLHQSSSSLADNYKLGFDVEKIDAVVITHVHVDHIGRLPFLAKQGYKNPIYATGETISMARAILNDSASLLALEAIKTSQNNVFKSAKKKLLRKTQKIREKSMSSSKNVRLSFYKELSSIEAGIDTLQTLTDLVDESQNSNRVLYNREHVNKCLSYCQPLETNVWHTILEGVDIKLVPNGHITGSVGVAVRAYDDVEKMKGIYFSGDIGKQSDILIKPPMDISDLESNIMVMESTYGNRKRNCSQQEDMETLEKVILRTISRIGRVLIPCLSNARAQLLLNILDEIYLKNADVLSRVPTYVDGTLLGKMSPFYMNESEWVKGPFLKGNIPNVIYSSGSRNGVGIYVASSGMINGGPSLTFAQELIGDSRNTIVFTSYQAEGTVGRKILEAENTAMVDIGGMRKKKKAESVQLKSFSSHADQTELVEYAKQLKNLETIILVHGNEEYKTCLKQVLEETFPENLRVIIPRKGDRVTFNKYGLVKFIEKV